MGTFNFNDIHLYHHFHGCSMSLCVFSWTSFYLKPRLSSPARPIARGHSNVICDDFFLKEGIQYDGSSHSKEALGWWLSLPYAKKISLMDLRVLKKDPVLEILTELTQGFKGQTLSS